MKLSKTRQRSYKGSSRECHKTGGKKFQMKTKLHERDINSQVNAAKVAQVTPKPQTDTGS